MPQQRRKYTPKRKKSKIILPALSALLIGGGLIAALFISKGGFDFRRQASEGAALKDKFGIGAGCGMAAEMGIPWIYNWGHGGKYPNSAEVDCNKSKGLSFFFTIGKTDNGEKYPQIDEWIDQHIQPDELADFEQYKNLVAQSTAEANYPNAIASYVLIPMYVNDLGYKGAYYAVANEPDFEPFFRPEVYADYYKLIHDRIKKYDPTSKVSVGGLLSVAPESCNRAAAIGLDCSNRFVWIDAVRNSYQSKYGTPLPADFWNIHPYVYTHNFTAAEALDRVDQFKAYLDRTGEGNKKIWITEFSVLANEGDLIGKTCSGNRWTDDQKKLPPVIYCLSSEDTALEKQMLADFMEQVVYGFTQREYVERWFWFYGGEAWTWRHERRNYSGDIYKLPETGEYNEIGKRYMRLMLGLPPEERENPVEPTPTAEPTATPTTQEPRDDSAVSAHQPKGWFDTVSCGQANGWTCDLDYPQGSVEVHFYRAEGGVPKQFLGKTTANIQSQNPADLQAIGAECAGNGSRRFSYAFPNLQISPGDEIHAIPIDLTSAGTSSGGANNYGINNAAKVVPNSVECIQP